MKKAVIILLVIMLLSFTVATILAGIQLQNMDTLQAKTVTVDKQREIELSKKLNNIKINSTIVSNINILSIEGNKIKVTLEGSYYTIMDRKVDIYLDNRGTTLDISIKEQGLLRFVQFGDYENYLTLNIYIPESYNKLLDINAFYDNLYIEQKVSDNMKINETNTYTKIQDQINNNIDTDID